MHSQLARDTTCGPGGAVDSMGIRVPAFRRYPTYEHPTPDLPDSLL